MDPARLRHAARLAEQWVTEGHTSGLVILVARRGAVVVHEASGRKRPYADAPALPRDALFPIASITKPITATAVMCLVEDGLVGLNRPVQEYVPEFVGEGKEHVTVRHLLTHTSGLKEEVVRQHGARKPRPLTLPPLPRTSTRRSPSGCSSGRTRRFRSRLLSAQELLLSAQEFVACTHHQHAQRANL